MRSGVGPEHRPNAGARRGFCPSRVVSSSRELSGCCCRARRDRAHLGRLREHSSGEGDERCEPANERWRRRRAGARADEVFVRRSLESGRAPVRARLGTPSPRLGGDGEQWASEREHRLLRRRRACEYHGEERDSDVRSRPLCAARPGDDSERDLGAGSGRELGTSVPSQEALRKRQRLCRPRRTDPSRRPLHGKLALPTNCVSSPSPRGYSGTPAQEERHKRRSSLAGCLACGLVSARSLRAPLPRPLPSCDARFRPRARAAHRSRTASGREGRR